MLNLPIKNSTFHHIPAFLSQTKIPLIKTPKERGETYLLMNQFTTQRVKRDIPRRGPDHNDPNIVEHQPLNSGDILGFDRRQFGPDLNPRAVGFGPPDGEDDGSAGESERVGVEGANEAGVVDEPALLPGAKFAEIFASYAAQLRRVSSLCHCSRGWISSARYDNKPISVSELRRRAIRSM